MLTGCIQTIRQDALPSDGAMKKLVFLKMATQVKKYYEGKGMREIISICDAPENFEYIDQVQVRKLLSKVFTDYFKNTRVGGLMSAESVSYFYTLASSRLGHWSKTMSGWPSISSLGSS